MSTSSPSGVLLLMEKFNVSPLRLVIRGTASGGRPCKGLGPRRVLRFDDCVGACCARRGISAYSSVRGWGNIINEAVCHVTFPGSRSHWFYTIFLAFLYSASWTAHGHKSSLISFSRSVCALQDFIVHLGSQHQERYHNDILRALLVAGHRVPSETPVAAPHRPN